MDTKLIRQKTKQVELIIELLKNAKMSRMGYDSTQEPFFKKDKKDEFIMNHKNLPKIPESLNRHIKVMYELIGDPNIEVYIGEWTILSLIKSSRLFENEINSATKNTIIIIQIEIGVPAISPPIKSLNTNPIEIIKTSRIAIFLKKRQ